MTGKTPLVGNIDGYTVSVFKADPDKTVIVDEFDLKLSRVGGARITNPESLIAQLEDAVFKQEEKDR